MPLNGHSILSKLVHVGASGHVAPLLDFPIPRITHGDNVLQRPPILEEVKEVVFSLSPKSAPSPDGFGAGFYQTCWQIIGEDLFDAIQEFFQGVQQPKGFSSAAIVLIPKVQGRLNGKITGRSVSAT